MSETDKENVPKKPTGVRVLLIDDQLIIAESIRRMLASEPDIELVYCQDPTKAVAEANRFAPTIILQDLVMPEIDGLTLLRFLRANRSTREVPIIVLSSKEEPKVKAQAFSLGASDYLVKLPDKIELIARIRHHSLGYIHLLERNEAYAALEKSERQMAQDLTQASKYVESLLPPPITGKVATDWRFIPCDALGGDAFGYHWIDDDHFAFYLLDVCGHGVKAALLSVSVLNALRSQTMPNTDFSKPGEVLARLNDAYPMERHFEMFFTIAYGVYSRKERRLWYAGGGHPPCLLLTGPNKDSLHVEQLKSENPMVGAFDGLDFEQTEHAVDAVGYLYLYSDGVFEIHRPGGAMWSLDEFIATMSKPLIPPETSLNRLLREVEEIGDGSGFLDDFSIVELAFNSP